MTQCSMECFNVLTLNPLSVKFGNTFYFPLIEIFVYIPNVWVVYYIYICFINKLHCVLFFRCIVPWKQTFFLLQSNFQGNYLLLFFNYKSCTNKKIAQIFSLKYLFIYVSVDYLPFFKKKLQRIPYKTAFTMNKVSKKPNSVRDIFIKSY